MSLAPGSKLAHYKILSEIGRGGMGVVYEAQDLKLDRRVALKVLPAEATANPERLERFRREAKAVAALNHPGIVTIHSVEETEGIHFLTMELVEGKTLHDLITSEGLPMEQIFQVAIQLAEALSVAHERGIIHRDLKPSNIVVSPSFHIKVLDFGLAKLSQPSDSGEDSILVTRTQQTAEGKILGTMPYMSPEQVAGRTLDSRTDIFSLGVILYEMATGRRPFSGQSTAELASSILRDNPISVSELRADVPGHLGWIVRRCLEKDPRRRYQSALDVRNELEDLKSGVGSPVSGAYAPSGERAAPGSGGGMATRPPSSPSYGSPPRSGPAVETPGKGGELTVKWIIFAALMLTISLGFTFLMSTRKRNERLLSDLGGLTGRRPQIPTPPTPRTGAPILGHPGSADGEGASLAIMPFVNMSADKDNEYFSDGMTEELINALAKVKGLEVPARSTVFALKGKNMSAHEVGEELEVENVLEGSVRKSGNRLRINVQLVSVDDGKVLWSEQYDRDQKDAFAVQEEISKSIAEALKLKLTPTEAESLARPPTTDAEAHNLYLKGRSSFYLSGRRNWGTAREYFSKAIALDPKYALAYAGIADASAQIYLYSEATPTNLQAVEEASKKALELAPDLAEAHSARAVALSLRKQYDQAAREFETAIKLNPKLYEAYYFYGRSCWEQGLYPQAAQLFEQAVAVAPDDYSAPALLGDVYRRLGREEDSKRAREKMIAVVQKRLAANPDDIRAIYLGAGGYIGEGQVEKGLEWAGKAVAMDPNDVSVLYNVACIYSGAGKKAEAIDTLEKAIKAGFANKKWIEHDADLDPIRNDPRFKAMLDKMK